MLVALVGAASACREPAPPGVVKAPAPISSTPPDAAPPPPRFAPSPFRAGEALRCLERGARLGCVDRSDEVVVPFEYEDAAFHPTAPFLFLRRPGGTWRIHDARTGAEQHASGGYATLADTPPRVVDRGDVRAPVISSGRFVLHGKHGIIDAKGALLVPPVFEALGSSGSRVLLAIHESGKPTLIPARHDGKYGAVNEVGRILVLLEHDEIVKHHEWSHILFLRKGLRWRIAHGVTGELLPQVFDEVETSNPYQGTFAATVRGREGRIDAETLAVVIPFEYVKLGFEVYSTEIGWHRSSHVYHDMTGVLCENGRWGVMTTSRRMVAECRYDRVLYDGYFFHGSATPISRMSECRADAARENVELVGFVVNGEKAVGWIDVAQTLHLLP